MPTFSPSSGSPGKVSPSLEQYIEAIADLLTRDKVCSVSDIAEQVQVSRPAASRAVRELSEQNLVDHKAYGYVDLTPKGRSIADRLSARHETLYNFLREILGFDEQWADQEACRLEHQVDDGLVARMGELAAFLDSDEDVGKRWRRRLQRFLRRATEDGLEG